MSFTWKTLAACSGLMVAWAANVSAQQATPPSPPAPPRTPAPRAERVEDRVQNRTERVEDRVERVEDRGENRTERVDDRAQRQTVLRPALGGAMNNDQTIASCLAIENNGEIQLAKLAMQHAKSDKTKDFAKMMMEDHSKALNHMLQIAPNALGNNAQPAPASATGAVAPAPGAPALPPASQPAVQVRAGQPIQGGQTAQGFNFLEVKRRIADECLANAKREMGQKQGSEFDAAYIGTMIVKHQEMHTALKVLRDYASPEFQQTLDQQSEVVAAHLDHAKQVMQTVSVKAAKDLEKQ